MKTRILTLFLSLVCVWGFAQNPHESYYAQHYNYHDFEQSMDVNVRLLIDGVDMDNFDYEIGAYNGTRLVGHGMLAQQTGYTHYYSIIKVYGDPENTGDAITFKLYNYEAGEELSLICPSTYSFGADSQFGTPRYPEELSFFNSKTCTFNAVSGNNWSTTANWSPSMPNEYDNVIIAAHCTIDVNATVLSTTLNTGRNITISENICFNSPTITISGSKTNARIVLNDNAQLFTNGAPKHTVKKDIAAYTDVRDNYYFISSPIGPVAPSSVTNLTTDGYELYCFSGWYPEEEWNNQQDETNYYWDNDNLEANKGYLYANENDVTISFGGTYNNLASVTKGELDYAEGADLDEYPWACFNLVGNPYSKNASVTGSGIAGYYIINVGNSRSNIIACANPIVAPCTGLMAVTTSNTATVTFTPSTNVANVRSNNNYINIEVNNAEGNLMDRAYVGMNDNNMVKFNLNSDATQLYFRQNNKDYAIASADRATQLPLYFETKEYGEYTINVKLENMNCEYLHLIDNMTGADVDLNVTPSYTFNAHQGDYASRFRLMFEGTGVEENNTESFVIVEGNRFIIPEAQNGSTLTIIDMMGRVVSSQTISGSFDQVMNLANGMYIVKLNGNSQKVIVR